MSWVFFKLTFRNLLFLFTINAYDDCCLCSILNKAIEKTTINQLLENKYIDLNLMF